MKLSRVALCGAVIATATAGHAASIRTVALAGDTAPGTGGAEFRSLFVHDLNDSGEVAFEAFLQGQGVTEDNDTGFFTSSALVAREGDAAPGVSGSTLNSLSLRGLNLNNAGDIVFGADFTDADGPGSGVFTPDGVIARNGDAAPGVGDATFSRLGTPDLNDSGVVAVIGDLEGPDANAGSNGIFTLSADGVANALAVRRNDAAPGTGGASFLSFGNPDINNAGDTAQRGFLVNDDTLAPPVNGRNDRTVFADGELVKRQGDTVGDELFISGFRNPAFNDQGDVVYAAELRTISGNAFLGEALFFNQEIITIRNRVFDGFTPLLFSNYVVNDTGTVAFSVAGRLDGNFISSVFTWNALDGFERILTEGDVIDVRGESRTLKRMNIGIGESLNAHGDILFVATFETGPEGVFVYEADRTPVAPVPAPAAAWLMLAGLGALASLRGRRRASPTVDV